MHYFTFGGNALAALYAPYTLMLQMGRLHWGSEGEGREGSQVTLEGSTEI